MNISMNVISEELADSFPLMNFHIQSDCNSLQRVMFLTDDISIPACNTLYIAENVSASLLSKIPENSGVIFFTQDSSSDLTDISGNYIILDSNCSPVHVLNTLQELFTSVNNWENDACRALLSGHGLQSLFDSARTLIENPIYLHDKNYRILVYSENRNYPSMKKSYDFLKTGKMSPKAILNLSKNPEFAKTFDSEHTAYCKKTSIWPDEYNYIYHNIKIHGNYIGRIFIDERIRPFRNLDYAVLDRLSELTAQILASHPFSCGCRKNQLEKLIEELLDNKPLAASDVLQTLAESGWENYHGFFCVSIPLQNKDLKYNIADSLCTSIQAAFSDCCVFPYHHEVACIIPIKEKDTRKTTFSRCLNTILMNYHLQAGVSSVFQNFTRLSSYYRQAYDVLNMLNRDSNTQSILFFDDYIMPYIIKQLSGLCDVSALYPDGLKNLIQHDRENTTNYVQTLRIYLECCCNQTQATKQLFIHRSTFLYRLEKIVEISNIDFNDFNQRLLYLIAFQLMDQLSPTIESKAVLL